MVDRIYSCIVLVDRDDSHLFGRFEEIQKVKQAVALLRAVYNSTTLDSVKNYLEKEQFGKTFSEIY
jgi:rRNA processing protein Krr1/Pno1